MQTVVKTLNFYGMIRYKIILAIGLFPFIVWAQQGLDVGQKAVFFQETDQHDTKYSLKSNLEKGPVIIFFYRGQWCSHCNRYMSNLQDSLTLITDLGASVVAITPEKEEEIDKTIEKTDAEFPIIYDKSHLLMDAYDVTFVLSATKQKLYMLGGINIDVASGNDDHVLPVPATYIIGVDGKIIARHFDRDYKSRMSVKEIVDVLSGI